MTWRRYGLWVGMAMLMAISFAGCCSVEVCDEGDRRLCYIENEGWKAFGLLPIVAGDPEHPNESATRWFTNTITLKSNVQLLNQMVKREGAVGVRDLCSYRTEEVIFPILLKRYIYHTSAELVVKP